MEFARPAFLALLVLVPAAILLQRASRREGGVRGTLIVVLRAGLLALLAVALAQPQVRRRSDVVTTYFLLDRSASIPEEMRRESIARVREAIETRRRREDRAGVIVFGRRAAVEEMPSSWLQVGEPYSLVDGSATDLAGAVRLALSTFPDDTQKRIVLFTDGNETSGSLREAAQRAAAAGCPIDVVPLRYEFANEVMLEELTVPRRAERDEPFPLRANVFSLGPAAGTLRLFCDGALVGSREVNLAKGDNLFAFSHVLREPGFHLLEARIEAARDGRIQNNAAQAYTVIEEGSRVLLAGGSPEDVRHLSAALTAEDIRHDVRVVTELPRDLGQWHSYDVILFSNLAAEHVSPEQMAMIESLVREMGAGFIMVGGEHSFGAGGYLNTPIARLLPVDLDVSQNQVLPNGGVAFVLDHVHCIGDRWSKDIVVGTLNAMTRMDELGLLLGDRPDWAIPLGPVTDKPSLIDRINAAHAGDVNEPDAALDRIIEAYRTRRVGYRHAVLITDGTGRIVPSDRAIARLREASITLSIAVIEPRGDNLGALRRAAEAGGGNFYVVQPHERERVPQIIARESQRVTKGLYFEETFVPELAQGSEIVEGLRASDLPPLHGYNVTSRKDPTEVPLISGHRDAVLAHWQVGLGRAVAFTSDVSGRWGRNWTSWPGFAKLWAQAVRWARRRMSASPYQLTIRRGEEGEAEAVVDAVDAEGRFVNFLDPAGSVLNPALERAPLEFRQTGPGRYRATFPAEKAGGYVVGVQYAENGATHLLRGGYVPPPGEEYRRFTDDLPLLTAATEISGGRMLDAAMDPFAPTSQEAWTAAPVWPALLLVALCLLPLDIVVRRVIVGFGEVRLLASRLMGRRDRRDPVREALEAARAALRETVRASWAPTGTAELAADRETVGVVQEAAPEPEPELTARLKEAKDRARRKFEK